jgi:hypothetical protein
MDTDMTDSNGDANHFGLSDAEWKFYQFVRSSPKVEHNTKREILSFIYIL